MTRLWLLVGVVFLSFSPIYVRLAALPPTTAGFFRVAYALPFLLALWIFQGRDRRAPRLRLQAGLAGVFLGVDLAFWHRSIELIGAGMATVLGNTQVIFVGLFAWWMYRERPRRAALVAVPMVLAGAVLISGLGMGDAYGRNPALGVVFGILTGMTYAVFLVILRAAGRELGAPAGPLLDATLGAALGLLAIGAFDGQLDFHVTWPAHGWMLALALTSQVVGWQLIAAALPRLPALETSVALLLQPVLSVIWGRLLFDERLSLLQGLGIGLVLAGVGWVSTRGATRRASRKDHGKKDFGRKDYGQTSEASDSSVRMSEHVSSP